MTSIPAEVDKQSNQYRVLLPKIIGVILSGSGSDGAKGIQAIKEAGGITFAEEENSADFFGMPSSAIQTGCVDFVLNPSDIAKGLIRISSQHCSEAEKTN